MAKGRRCANAAMLCQGARGLTRQGARALILARCASSAAINKLDVIMPPVEDFPARHIGPRKHDVRNMLKQLGFRNLDELTDAAVPDDIKLNREMLIDEPVSEHALIQRIQGIANKNKIWRSYIGMGYYNTCIPHTILRNMFENPGDNAVHALPARNCAGSIGIVVELPNGGVGAHRARGGQLLSAGRGHCCCRGLGALLSGEQTQKVSALRQASPTDHQLCENPSRAFWDCY